MIPPDEVDQDHKGSKSRRVVAGVAIALAAAVLGFGLLRPAARDGAGGQAPEFDLPFLSGDGRLSSVELKGTPVVINLWASWCLPCREEMPALQAVSEKYKDRIVVLGVNVRDREEDARAFVDEIGVTYPIVRDANRTLEAALGAFGLPETYFVDHNWRFIGVYQGGRPAGARDDSRTGNVYLGGISEEELERNVLELLEQQDEGS